MLTSDNLEVPVYFGSKIIMEEGRGLFVPAPLIIIIIDCDNNSNYLVFYFSQDIGLFFSKSAALPNRIFPYLKEEWNTKCDNLIKTIK